MFRELNRKQLQLSAKECAEVLNNEKRGVLSVIGDEGYPYGMPMNHWYDEQSGCIYFHCGRSGHRYDSVKNCSKASFCVYSKGEKEEGEWAWKVKSVIVFGNVEIIDDAAKTARISRELSLKFTSDEEYIAKEIEAHLKKTVLLKLSPVHICGKRVVEE